MNPSPRQNPPGANSGGRAALNSALVRVLAALSTLALLTVFIFFGILIRQKIEAKKTPADPLPTSESGNAGFPPVSVGRDTEPSSGQPGTEEGETDRTVTEPAVPETAEATDTAKTPETEPQPVTEPPVTEPPAPPVQDPGVPSSPVIVKEAADPGADYLKDVYFLGDSTTYGMMVYAKDLVSYDHIWAGSGGTIDFTDITNKIIKWPDAVKSFMDWEEITIAEALRRARPKILIVTLGINYSPDGNATWTDEKREQYFRKQVKAVYDTVKENSPETKLAFQTIYPTIDDRTSIKNSRVDLRNKWLLAECEALNIPLLWSHTYMGDSNGQLIASYNADHLDGIHLNTAGFRAVITYVRTHPIS